MNVANELCDRIAIINKGQIIKLDTPENLKKLEKKYQAIDLYLSDSLNVSELNQLTGIEKVEEKKTYYHIIVNNLDQAIGEIIDYTKSKNVKIKRISTPEPSLEEVFVKIINRGENN
jgi:ABC-2 type transport system ATP-binding protein